MTENKVVNNETDDPDYFPIGPSRYILTEDSSEQNNDSLSDDILIDEQDEIIDDYETDYVPPNPEESIEQRFKKMISPENIQKFIDTDKRKELDEKNKELRKFIGEKILSDNEYSLFLSESIKKYIDDFSAVFGNNFIIGILKTIILEQKPLNYIIGIYPVLYELTKENEKLRDTIKKLSERILKLELTPPSEGGAEYWNTAQHFSDMRRKSF